MCIFLAQHPIFHPILFSLDIYSCLVLDKVKPSLSRSTGDISNFVPPHVVSPPLLQDSVMNACHRGCRLYSICQFVNGNAGFNTSKEECQGGEDTKGRKPK